MSIITPTQTTTTTRRAALAWRVCQHARTMLDTTGRLAFSGGAMSDTLIERVVCLDCGCEVEPEPAADDGEDLPI